MRSALTLLMLALITALTAAGCGGPEEGSLEASRERADKQHGAEEGGEADEKSEEDAEASGDQNTEEAAALESSGDSGGAAASVDLAEGKELFGGKCASCHVLADAGATGSFGPSLDDVKPTADETLEQIKNGGGGMPANLLEGADADTVAGYVEAVAGK